MTEPRDRAEAVIGRIEADMQRFLEMPDEPNGRVHSLFAGLYLETTKRWIAGLSDFASPEFAYTVITHFYALYEDCVLRELDTPLSQVAPQWRLYHRLSRRLTMRSAISSHLLLISLGARAHTRHDLASAIARAAEDYADPDIARREHLIGALSARAFREAALDYVAWHRQRQSGWRYGVLSLYARGLKVLRFIWVPVMEGWRQAAYADAVALAGDGAGRGRRIRNGALSPADP